MAEPKNLAAVRKWFKENKPDVSDELFEALVANHGLWGLILMGFEAGREFQKENPDVISVIGY